LDRKYIVVQIILFSVDRNPWFDMNYILSIDFSQLYILHKI